jgi:hypothetical protein
LRPPVNVDGRWLRPTVAADEFCQHYESAIETDE